jgi:hypothetical protein
MLNCAKRNNAPANGGRRDGFTANDSERKITAAEAELGRSASLVARGRWATAMSWQATPMMTFWVPLTNWRAKYGPGGRANDEIR